MDELFLVAETSTVIGGYRLFVFLEYRIANRFDETLEFRLDEVEDHAEQ